MNVNLNFVSKNPATSLEDINEFEKEEQLILPDDYKVFLLAVNGGQLRRDQEIILQDGSKYGLSLTFESVFGIKVSDDDYDLMSLLFRRNHYGDILPEHLLAIIGCSDGHYRIVLSTAPNEYGYIYAWDNQAPFDYSEATLIAKSFTEFLGMITEVDHEASLARYYRLRDRSKGKSNEE